MSSWVELTTACGGLGPGSVAIYQDGINLQHIQQAELEPLPVSLQAQAGQCSNMQPHAACILLPWGLVCAPVESGSTRGAPCIAQNSQNFKVL